MRVIIADDHLLFLKGLEEMINKVPEFELIAAISDGKRVVEQVSELKPDLVVLDLNFKTIDGFTILKEIRKLRINPIVVFVTMYNDPAIVIKAMELGANGFFVKETDPAELMQVLLKLRPNEFKTSEKIVVDGEQWTESPAGEQYPDEFQMKAILTTREIDILRLIAQGKAARDIGELLFISPNTVDTHRKNMQKKLGIKKISELVKYAVNHKLI